MGAIREGGPHPIVATLQVQRQTDGLFKDNSRRSYSPGPHSRHTRGAIEIKNCGTRFIFLSLLEKKCRHGDDQYDSGLCAGRESRCVFCIGDEDSVGGEDVDREMETTNVGKWAFSTISNTWCSEQQRSERMMRIRVAA